MTRCWPLAVLLAVLAMLVSPMTASASIGLQAETRVKGFFLVATALVGGSSSRTLEKHPGNAAAYDETASGYALAAEGAAGLGGEVTPLFRAVMNPELEDIAAQGAFRNPVGIESKYFSTTAEGAASYARQAYRAFGDGPFTIVRTGAPPGLISPGMRVMVDRGIQTVVLPTEALGGLSAPEILLSIPLP